MQNEPDQTNPISRRNDNQTIIHERTQDQEASSSEESSEEESSE